MPFKSISADPQELQKLGEAFDNAWAEVNSARPVDPLKAAAERERLGYIVAQLWQADPNANLATQAVLQFMKGQAEPPVINPEATSQM